MYEFAGGTLEVVIAVFQGYCLQYFCGYFLERRLWNDRGNALLITGFYVVLKGIVDWLAVWDSKSITILIRQTIFICVLFIMVLCCYRAVRWITLFVVVIFMAFKFKTGNLVADALLTMKYYEIIHEIPDMKWNLEGFVLPAALSVHGFDLGVILGNALDNALEACRKLRREKEDAELFIRLTSFQREKLLCIKIENSFDGTIRRTSQSEFPLTNKRDMQSHGIGLSNIKHTVEKYEGAVDWRVRGRVFVLSVMLKNERKG